MQTQKADKGIRQMEEEEKRLALILPTWETLTKQRKKKGNWK